MAQSPTSAIDSLCVRGFSFPWVRKHTHTHTYTLKHTDTVTTGPFARQRCTAMFSLRGKSASQKQEMIEQTHTQAALCHHPAHARTVSYVHPQLELVKAETAGPACLCQTSDATCKLMATTFSCAPVLVCVCADSSPKRC